MRQKIAGDLVWGLVLAAIAVVLLGIAYWPATVGNGYAAGWVWPRGVLWVLLGLSLLLILISWNSASDESDREPLRLPFFVAMTGAGYVVGIAFVGLLAATLVFAAILPRVLGRPSRESLIFSCLLTALIWLCFIKLLGVPLPKGVGPFHALSNWLS